MKKKYAGNYLFLTLAVSIAAGALFVFDALNNQTQAAAENPKKDFEVWLVDQSNSNGLTYGGYIHVYEGRDLTDNNPSDAAPTATIDLSGDLAQLCRQRTNANPVRPHMLTFNSTDSHASLSFVASGHVAIFDARTRQPLDCFRTEPGAGGARQAHAIWATSDDRYLLVANQNGKKFERIRTDYATNTYTQEPAATLDLANCTTPNGQPCQTPALRPDNAPICPITPSNNGPAFVSLRGGGMFVVDWQATPMSIVGEYDKANIPANGCGFIEARGWIFGNGGGGTANNLDQFTVYRLPMTGYAATNSPNTPAVQVLYNDDSAERDAHGVGATKHEKYVWVGDRDGNLIEVFDSETGAKVNNFNLVSAYSADPTPDLFAKSPDHKWMFVSLRGPTPLSGDPHSSSGLTPGLLIVRVNESGRDGVVKGLVPISNIDAGGIQRADAHGIRVRKK